MDETKETRDPKKTSRKDLRGQINRSSIDGYRKTPRGYILSVIEYLVHSIRVCVRSFRHF